MESSTTALTPSTETKGVLDGHEIALDLTSQSSTCSSNSSGSQPSLTAYRISKQKPYAKFNRTLLPKASDEYKVKRERNNEAVKKSREKSKSRVTNTIEHVTKLQEDNAKLTREIDVLTK